MRALIFITVLTFIGLTLVVYNPSKDYWENVGPQWDRMLNPCKFEKCE
jgi:hypothetical protein